MSDASRIAELKGAIFEQGTRPLFFWINKEGEELFRLEKLVPSVMQKALEANIKGLVKLILLLSEEYTPTTNSKNDD